MTSIFTKNQAVVFANTTKDNYETQLKERNNFEVRIQNKKYSDNIHAYVVIVYCKARIDICPTRLERVVGTFRYSV